jgi:O-antigen/teichoic acid export membrane protein
MVGSLRGVLEAAQRFDLVNAVRAPLGSANFLLPCVGALLGWNLPQIIGLLVLSSCAALLIYYRLCVRVFPLLKARPTFRRSELIRLVTFGSWVMVSSIIGPILVYLDRFMVGTLLSIEAVGYYSAPYEMVTRLWIVPASLTATLFPAFSTLSAQGQSSSLKQLVPRSIRYVLVLLGPVIVITVVFARDILRIWLGAGFAERSAAVLSILAVGVLLNSLAQVPYALIQGFDRPDLTAKLHLVELPIHIALVWILVGHFGLAGAALAWSLRATLDAATLFWVASKVTHLPARTFIGDRMGQTIAVIGLLGCGAAIANLLFGGWLEVAVLACLLGVAGVALWRYSLDDGDRSWINSLLRPAQSDGVLSSRETRSP